MRPAGVYRDPGATILVVAAATLYGLTTAGFDLPGFGSTRAVAAVVFALGLVGCSIGADVETFYRRETPPTVMAVESALGATALGAGIAAVVTGSEIALAILVAAMVVLWIAATARHVRAAPAEPSLPRPADRQRVGAGR